MDDVERWRLAMTQVVDLIGQYPGKEDNLWLRGFPAGSCSVASFAIGRLLLERDGEDWSLHSRSGRVGTHTWLVLDEGGRIPARASIDATAHQFEDVTGEPFVGFGDSPAEAHFPDLMGDPVLVSTVEDWWHHGSTREVYEWMFPQLGLQPFR